MSKVFVNKTLILFQFVAFFLLIMLGVYLFGIWNLPIGQKCLFSGCVGPVYLVVILVYIGGTVLSPIRIEVFNESVVFSHFIKARTKNIPFNRINEINPDEVERRNQIIIQDKHGENHRFYMIGPKISKEIISRFEEFRKNEKEDDD